MPISGARYRYTKSGTRLAFKNGKVVEAKAKSGRVHTPAEFAADVKRNRARAVGRRVKLESMEKPGA